MNDVTYRLARERLEEFRADAARNRMVRSDEASGRLDHRSVRLWLGVRLMRIGRAVAGLRRDIEGYDDTRAHAELVRPADS